VHTDTVNYLHVNFVKHLVCQIIFYIISIYSIVYLLALWRKNFHLSIFKEYVDCGEEQFCYDFYRFKECVECRMKQVCNIFTCLQRNNFFHVKLRKNIQEKTIAFFKLHILFALLCQSHLCINDD